MGYVVPKFYEERIQIAFCSMQVFLEEQSRSYYHFEEEYFF